MGYWGPNLLRTINAHPSCHLKFGVDLDKKKLEKFKDIYTETSFSDDLNLSLVDASIDYIVISTPPETHYEIAKLCLENKKNILVTKPLCLNAEDAKYLLKLGEANNCRILIDETFIFSDQVLELKKIIKNKKEFGELTFINSNRVNLGLFQQKTNVIWDLAPHDIAITSFILGEYPKKVRSTAINPLSNKKLYESYANCEYYFLEHDILFTAQISWLSPVKTRRMVFGGTKQTVVYDHLELEAPLKVFNQQILTNTTSGVTNYDYVVGSQYIPKVQINDALDNELDNLVDSHFGKRKFFSDISHGVNSVTILQALEESTKLGGKLIDVEILD